MDKQDKVRYLANICCLLIADGDIDPTEQEVFEEISQGIGAGFPERQDAVRLARGPEYRVRPVGRWSRRVRNLEDMLLAAYCNGVVAPTEKKIVKEYAGQLGITQKQLDVIRKETEARCRKYLRPAAAPDDETSRPVPEGSSSAIVAPVRVGHDAGSSGERPIVTPASLKDHLASQEVNPAVVKGFLAVGGCLFGMFFLAAALAALGAAAGTVWAVIALASAHGSQDWPSVEGRIVSSEVRSKRVTYDSSSGTRPRRHSHSYTVTRYYPAITYEYCVSGKTYSGRRIMLMGSGLAEGNKAHARLVCRRYPEGKVVDVYYDPADPEIAVLERGASGQNYLALILCPVVMLVFGGISVFMFLMLRKFRAAFRAPLGPASAQPAAGPAAAGQRPTAGPADAEGQRAKRMTAATQGLMPIWLHLTMWIPAQIVGAMGSAIAVMTFVPSPHGELPRAKIALSFGAFILGALIPRLVFKYLVPAKCPQCGGRAFFASLRQSQRSPIFGGRRGGRTIVYRCKECGHVHVTGVQEGGSRHHH